MRDINESNIVKYIKRESDKERERSGERDREKYRDEEINYCNSLFTIYML